MGKGGSPFGACPDAFLPRHHRDPGIHSWALERGRQQHCGLPETRRCGDLESRGCSACICVQDSKSRAFCASRPSWIWTGPPSCRKRSPPDAKETEMDVPKGRGWASRLKNEQHPPCLPFPCPITLRLLTFLPLRSVPQTPRFLPAFVGLLQVPTRCLHRISRAGLGEFPVAALRVGMWGAVLASWVLVVGAGAARLCPPPAELSAPKTGIVNY